MSKPMKSATDATKQDESLLEHRSLDEQVIRVRGAGSVLRLNDTVEFNRLQQIAVEESPSGIPILFALNVVE